MKTIIGIISLLVTVSSANGVILITQYYEGASSDKYIELTNIGTTAVDFSSTNFTVALYSNAARENWKSGGAANSTTLLDSGTLASGASLVLRNSSAAAPSYAASLGITSSTVNFNGDDSWVLFSGSSIAFANVVDSFGVTASGFADTSFVRASASATNADFNASLWTQVSLADVASAGASDEARLGYSAVPEPSTYAAILGAMGLAYVMVRRRRQADKQ